MWCPEGYLTLAEITEEFDCLAQGIGSAKDHPDRININELGKNFYIDTGPTPDEMQGYINRMTYLFFYFFGNEIRVCLGSGSIVRPHGLVLSRHAEDDWWDYTDQFDPFPDTYKARRVWFYREFKYLDTFSGCLKVPEEPFGVGMLSPINGAALCILSSKLPVELQELTYWLEEQASQVRIGNQPKSKLEQDMKNLAKKIVEGRRAGKHKNKSQAKAIYASGMKVDAWLAVWKEACKIMPELSRPGPDKVHKSVRNA